MKALRLILKSLIKGRLCPILVWTSKTNRKKNPHKGNRKRFKPILKSKKPSRKRRLNRFKGDWIKNRKEWRFMKRKRKSKSTIISHNQTELNINSTKRGENWKLINRNIKINSRFSQIKWNREEQREHIYQRLLLKSPSTMMKN